MSRPVEGEPYFAYPGAAISAGDPNAAPGTDAWKAVVVLEAGLPSPNIIDTGGTFDVEIRFRTVLAGMPFLLPAGLAVNIHVHDLAGVPAAGSPFAGTAPALIAAPAGDSGPRGMFDVVNWYSSTTAVSIGLPDGTYRITVLGNEPVNGLMFFHEGTVVHVGP